MEVEAAGASEVAGAGEFQVFEIPANGETKGIVEFGALAGGKWELREAGEEPGKRVLTAAGVVEPALPGNVGFDVGVFFEQRNETRPGIGTGALGLVVVPVIVPGYVNIAWNTVGEPVSDVEGERVLHGGGGDAGSVEVVEWGHVGVGGAEFLDAFVKGIEKTLDARDVGWRVRKRAEKKQALVEADELVRVSELELGELGEEFGDEGGVAGVEATFGGFECGQELVGVLFIRFVGSERHGRRDSVTQAGDASPATLAEKYEGSAIGFIRRRSLTRLKYAAFRDDGLIKEDVVETCNYPLVLPGEFREIYATLSPASARDKPFSIRGMNHFGGVGGKFRDQICSVPMKGRRALVNCGFVVAVIGADKEVVLFIARNHEG